MTQELTKTNRLLITVLVIVAVIIIGLLTISKPEVQYKLSAEESLKMLADKGNVVEPKDALALLKNSNSTLFIDVRIPVDFEKGHVEKALNIPMRELFSKENRAKFKDIDKAGQTAVLYGETAQQASGAWFMLKQAGIKNVKLYMGNYEQLNLNQPDSVVNKLASVETSAIDTVALKAMLAPKVDATKAQVAAPVKKVVKVVKTQHATGGGC